MVKGGVGTLVGGSVEVVDAVSGGGRAWRLARLADADPGSRGGDSPEAPGDATNFLHGTSLSRSNGAQILNVQASAYGGINTTKYSFSNRRAGDALAEADATNVVGLADANALAVGGNAMSLATATGGTETVYGQEGIVYVLGAGHATSEAMALGEGAARARAVRHRRQGNLRHLLGRRPGPGHRVAVGQTSSSTRCLGGRW